MNEAGQVWVCSADRFEILHLVDLGEDAEGHSRSSLSLADGQVFVRTADRLYCFGSR